jgi:transcriptional antiterminator
MGTIHHSLPAQLSLEARMVLKTLEHQPMSIAALERHWWPTWSIEEIRAIVTQLHRQNLIQFTDRVLERGHYVAQAHPTARKKAARASIEIRS